MAMTVEELIGKARRFFEGSALETSAQPRYPPIAVEITPDRILGVRLGQEKKNGGLTLQCVASASLPEGAIEPSLIKPNILAPEPVSLALETVLSSIASGERRISLLLPDQVARVAILGFANLPRTRPEVLDLVRFRMAKSLPFKSEAAAVDLMLLGGGGGGPSTAGTSVLAAFINRPVLEQYEDLLIRKGYWPGLVGLTSIELCNLFRDRLGASPGGDKDVLLMNITRHEMTLLIFRGPELIFYRCKPHPVGAAGEERITALRREVYTSFAFYQEKLLGRGIGRAFLRSVGIPLEAVRDVVAGEAGCPLETLDLHDRVKPAEDVQVGSGEAMEATPAVGAVAGRRP